MRQRRLSESYGPKDHQLFLLGIALDQAGGTQPTGAGPQDGAEGNVVVFNDSGVRARRPQPAQRLFRAAQRGLDHQQHSPRPQESGCVLTDPVQH